MSWTKHDLLAHQLRWQQSKPLATRLAEAESEVEAEEREVGHGGLQEKLIAHCKKHGWFVVYSRSDLPATTPLGTPDFIIFADGGRVIVVEAKSRTGKLRPAQLGIKLMLEQLGHTVHVIRSLEEFLAVVTK